MKVYLHLKVNERVYRKKHRKLGMHKYCHNLNNLNKDFRFHICLEIHLHVNHYTLDKLFKKWPR